MGAFWAICRCGKPYLWFSHHIYTLARAKQCDECWKKDAAKRPPEAT